MIVLDRIKIGPSNTVSRISAKVSPMNLPEEMVTILAAFAPLFSERVWIHAQVLITGAILAIGKRTVTSALRIMGKSEEEGFTNYHRVLNRDKWDTKKG